MPDGNRATPRRARTLMASLRTDTSANTLAMMAIALIPLSALVGSGVDTARTYVVRTRLQQACDAGVLAGRKFMQISDSATLDTNAASRAQAFFNNNFTPGWMGTSEIEFTPAKTTDQQVTGTASAVVPMTIMRMFEATDLTVEVACEARYDVADSDIMFVLDVTGSMACTPEVATCTTTNTSYTYNGATQHAVIEHSGSRMQALRAAVVDFDTTVRSNADPSTRIRYGFVPYASGVNVGAAIPAEHMVRTRWTYQSRRQNGEGNYEVGNWSNNGNYTTSNCSNAEKREPSNGFRTDNTATYTDSRIENSRCQTRTRVVAVRWQFEPIEYDIAAYYQTLFNSGSVRDPTRREEKRSTWQGCIEERRTDASTSFNITNLPPDLNPDLIPSSNETRWKPMWPDVTWGRGGNAAGVNAAYKDSDFEASALWNPYNAGSRAPGGFAACPPAARRLAEMTSTQVSNYVNAPHFRPHGGTYHDIGMIWGVRMLSPNGIFSADTAAGSGRAAPRRHIVFMTDGQLAPNGDIYGAYGIQRYDNRIGGGIDIPELTRRHNARFLAVCQYARDRLNMTVWVVALSTGLNDDLRSCATPGDHAFTASSKTELQNAFKKIAQQVAMLRVSK